MITLHNVHNLKRMVHGSYEARNAQKWGITNYRGQKCQHVEFIPLSELLADPKLYNAKIYSLEYVVKISWSFDNVWESYGQNRTWGVKSVNVEFHGFSVERKVIRGHYHVGKCPKDLKTKFGGLRVKISSKTSHTKVRGHFCQQLKVAELTRSLADRIAGTIRSVWSAQYQYFAN